MPVSFANRDAVTKKEVEAKLASVGDYVKMDYLQSCLKKDLDFDTRKFVLMTLSNIYETKKMYLESGKMIRNAAEINTTFEGKMNDFMKSVELFIRAGLFAEADISFAKALACGTELQKSRLKLKHKELYKSVAKDFLIKDKRKHALEAYEKLYSLDLSPDEKNEVKNALMPLYEKLGKIREYNNLKRM